MSYTKTIILSPSLYPYGTCHIPEQSRVEATITLIVCIIHLLQLSPLPPYVGRGTSSKAIRKLEYALEQ